VPLTEARSTEASTLLFHFQPFPVSPLLAACNHCFCQCNIYCSVSYYSLDSVFNIVKSRVKEPETETKDNIFTHDTDAAKGEPLSNNERCNDRRKRQRKVASNHPRSKLNRCNAVKSMSVYGCRTFQHGLLSGFCALDLWMNVCNKTSLLLSTLRHSKYKWHEYWCIFKRHDTSRLNEIDDQFIKLKRNRHLLIWRTFYYKEVWFWFHWSSTHEEKWKQKSNRRYFPEWLDILLPGYPIHYQKEHLPPRWEENFIWDVS